MAYFDSVYLTLPDDIALARARGVNDTGREELSLEALALLVQTQRIDHLEGKMRSKTDEIKGRQGKVRKLHGLLNKINNASDKKGKLDISKNSELKELLDQARDLGVDIKKDKKTWSKEEKEHLIEDIRMACDDLSSENQMAMQDAQAHMNQRYEVYEMTKNIMKTLHEDIRAKVRRIANG
ncbi:MAG: hypothetical protein ACQEP8_05970 [Chlamydiota bacterium]